MTIIEQLARFLAARLRLPFETGSEAAVFFGYMQDFPVKAVGVYANGLRAPGDPEGTRVQVIIRSDQDGGWPLDMAARITELLDEQRDLLFVPGGDYVSRVATERGFEFSGIADNGTQLYAADFTIYHCG